MTTPIIIACAITGSVPRKKDNPAVPTTPSEQIESTHAAFEAGATLAHIHVRDDEENPSSDQARFAKVMEGIRKHCPGMIIQLSTGGRGRDPEARGDLVQRDVVVAAVVEGLGGLAQDHPALLGVLLGGGEPAVPAGARLGLRVHSDRPRRAAQPRGRSAVWIIDG